ncbi:MAG: hypothetical protein M1445_06350, partial [Bacteroidetes bacterium]|nr:hypothetical protein [Bacteroidota bacterium]
MEENSFQLKQACTVKFSSEEQAYALEQITEMHPEYDQFTTFKTVFNDLLYRATAKAKQSNQSLPADLEKIQNLENEIGRLKTLIDLKEEELIRTKEENINLSQTGQGLKLADNQTVITFNPLVALLLDEEIQAAEKKTGKRFTREDILKNLFWDTIRRISNYPLCLLRSSSEIAASFK